MAHHINKPTLKQSAVLPSVANIYSLCVSSLPNQADMRAGSIPSTLPRRAWVWWISSTGSR